MRTHDPLWTSPRVRRLMAAGDAGSLVRLGREARGWRQEDLGDRVGCSASTISRLEHRAAPGDVQMLRQIADSVGMPRLVLGAVLGLLPARTTTVTAQVREEDDPMRRRELLAWASTAAAASVLGSPLPAAAAPLSGLDDLLVFGPPTLAVEPTAEAAALAVQASRADVLACRYDALARALPQRLALAQASRGEPGQRASAELFAVAARLCIKLGDDRLTAITADRAVTAAAATGAPLVLAEAHRMVSSAHRRHGQYGRATAIAVRAADQLAGTRTPDTAGRLSARGNLLATATYSAAKAGDRDTAHALLAEARGCAVQLGRDTPAAAGGYFGADQVSLHEVSVHHLLGDAGAAVEQARRIAVQGLPRERRARLYLDLARAYELWGKPDQTLRALTLAERAAPQDVRRSSVRTLAVRLLHQPRPVPGGRDFARRIGAI
ncbi:multiprotein-bridging factor 1 family protein [Streptomyces sp. R21]|uniref:Multiprotein-bridging factor 1 family protein n=1 Tax=Streptomyces sp. R21 TaxID=3238627 RepID=A0AB39P2A7_9ACTN